MLKLPLLSALMALPFTLAVTAAEQTFDFKDPKGVNHASFALDAPLEAISGNANGVSGTLTIDPARPEATKGSILVDAKTLSVENALMKQHLLGADWMDVEKFPTITFTVGSLADVKKDGATVTATVKGKFSVKGVEKDISVPAKVTLLPGRLADRTGGKTKGDLMVVRTEFIIKRSDYGINPKAPTDKVADEVKVTIAIAGACPE